MKTIFTFCLLWLSVNALAQVSLRGRVMDDTLGTPLNGTGVFISELSRLAVTNEKGEYEFKKLPKGKFVVQFKSLGYKPFITLVEVNDTTIELNVRLSKSIAQYPEVVIYGGNNSADEKTANTISQLSVGDMRLSGAINLSDGIAKIPGVSQLTTGNGISKPVIRGLFGNRIQTVLMGLRFDNQQWQDEHGLGLSDVGIDRVEIIKGPSSLLYGSEAMGGVLNIIEEKPAPVSKVAADVSLRAFSNTLGYATDVGVKGSGQKFNWRIRLGDENHADYSDGNNNRVLNSRFGGQYAKATLGYKGKRWLSQNNYMYSQSNFGFLMDSVDKYGPPDARDSRTFDRPHHSVYLNMFSSQNSFFLNSSKIKLNFGYQDNNRQEQEGGNKISLNMILDTWLANLLWTKTINHTEISIGSQGFYQTNTNIGSRTIIPDADLWENSVYGYVKTELKKLVIEGGLRYDHKNIKTFPTGNINTDSVSPGKTVLPFDRNYNSCNGSLGFSWFDRKHLNIKANFSSGYRAANLAELSSNGLHEGTLRYEIGDNNLKVEQNACVDLSVAYQSKFITLNASGYYNHFFNYIYLAPTTTEYIGFQIFRYIQHNAAIRGVELLGDIHPQKIKWFNWITSYSYVYGRLDNGDYLPFIPAPKLNSDIKLSFSNSKKISEFFIRPGYTWVFAQNRPAEFETATKQYQLVNAAAGIVIKGKKIIFTGSISGNNLLNEVYYDHLSRFKYFNIYNMGRNISVNLKFNFN